GHHRRRPAMADHNPARRPGEIGGVQRVISADCCSFVMAGLVPAIHDFIFSEKERRGCPA
ncbi:MAG: hypothetical protein WAM72_23190, partial [Xanthobacteraceae bacterium]